MICLYEPFKPIWLFYRIPTSKDLNCSLKWNNIPHTGYTTFNVQMTLSKQLDNLIKRKGKLNTTSCNVGSNISMNITEQHYACTPCYTWLCRYPIPCKYRYFLCKQRKRVSKITRFTSARCFPAVQSQLQHPPTFPIFADKVVFRAAVVIVPLEEERAVFVTWCRGLVVQNGTHASTT